MQKNALLKDSRWWIYAVMPAVILNVVSILTYGVYYTLKYTQPLAVAGIPENAVALTSYLIVFVVEWLFALNILAWLRSNKIPLRAVLWPSGKPLQFRWGPALAMGLGINVLFAGYFWVAFRIYGDFSASYHGFPWWGQVFQVVLLPLTAAFCEELIWRGYLLTQLQLRGYQAWKAILLMSLSFSLIHGVFLVDKLVVTFIVGLMTGWYYWKERNLLPVMAAHWILDVWGFLIFALRLV